MTIPGFVNGDCIAGNLKMSGNTLSSTDTNGDLNLVPDGTGDVISSKADIGGRFSHSVINSDNTNTSSQARFVAEVGGSGGGDPYYAWSILGVVGYSFGPDNSDSDTMKLNSSQFGPSSGSTLFSLTQSGNPSFPTGTGFLGLPGGTTAQQPGSPTEGMIRKNTSNNYPEYYDGTAWRRIPLQQSGAFTPVLDFGGGTTGITYSQQDGRYVKIGKMLQFSVTFILTSKGTDTGAARITGFPAFLPSTQEYVITRTQSVTYSGNELVGLCRNNGGVMDCLLQNITSGGTPANLTDTAFVNTSRLTFNGVIEVA